MTDATLRDQAIAELEQTTVGYASFVKKYGHPPGPDTHWGKGLALLEQITASPTPAPTPDATFRKLLPGTPPNLKSGDRVWLLPGHHVQLDADGLSDVKVIGDPAGGVTCGGIRRHSCTRVDFHAVDMPAGLILPVHTWGASRDCQLSHFTVGQSADSAVMDEDSDGSYYGEFDILDPGRGSGGPGYHAHGLYLRCTGLVEQGTITNALYDGISVRRGGMTVRYITTDPRCGQGMGFYSYAKADATGAEQVVVEDCTFGGRDAAVWLSAEKNGPSPSQPTPVGPWPVFYFRRVTITPGSRDGFSVAAAIAGQIKERSVT